MIPGRSSAVRPVARKPEHHLPDGQAVDPIAVVGGHCVADDVPGVVADHGEPLVAELGHQRGQVVGEGGASYPPRGLLTKPDPALIDCDGSGGPSPQ